MNPRIGLPELNGIVRGILVTSADGTLYLVGVDGPTVHDNPSLYRLDPAGWTNLKEERRATEVARALLEEMKVEIPDWYKSHHYLYRLFLECRHSMERVMYEGIRH